MDYPHILCLTINNFLHFYKAHKQQKIFQVMKIKCLLKFLYLFDFNNIFIS